MKTTIQKLGIASVSLWTLCACGGGSGVSGVYVAEIPNAGYGFELDFQGDGKGTITMVAGDERQPPLDCTYTSGEATIMVNCIGSSGFSLTKLDNGDLEGSMGGTLVRYEKR
jgi:hypothetical protein